MAVSAEEVINLAKATQALKPEQLAKIVALAPKMQADDLEGLKHMIEKVQSAEENTKQELRVREEVESKYKVFKKEKTMDELHKAEDKSQSADDKVADNLLNTI